MSNEEQQQLDSLQANIDDRFILPADGMVETQDKPEFVTDEKPRFKPKVPVAKAASDVTTEAQAQAPQDDLSVLNARIKDMERAMELLKEGRDGIRLRAAAIERKPIDWNKIQEKDIFDLNVNIDTINHDMPDYMLIVPKDSNYVLRWVHKLPRRLGPMKAKGFQFARPEDIEGELNIALEVDENGQIRFDDVLLMKIEKRLYYGMLRANHKRAVEMVDQKKAHELAQERVLTDIRSGNTGTKGVEAEQVSSKDFNQYVGSNTSKSKMNVYIPGEI
jgi:hypothetical protein